MTPRSIALPLLLALSACPADPTPVDTTDGTTTTDSGDPTTNDPTNEDTCLSMCVTTTEDPTSTTTVDPSDPTTTTVDPSDPTTTTTDADSSTTDASSETTHASHGTETTESSSSTDAQESSSSSTAAQEESSSSDTGPPPDCDAGDGPLFTVTNNGFASYTINGQSNPDLTVVRGCDYTFDITANGHPFYLKTVQGAGVGNAYNTGVVGNGMQNGDLTWTVAGNTPDDLFYNCQFHAAMTGTITVID